MRGRGLTVSEKMAEEARRSGLEAAAAASRGAEEGRGHAEVLRRSLVEKHAEPPADKLETAE